MNGKKVKQLRRVYRHINAYLNPEQPLTINTRQKVFKTPGPLAKGGYRLTPYITHTIINPPRRAWRKMKRVLALRW